MHVPLEKRETKQDLLKKKTKQKTCFNAFWIVGLGILLNHIVAVLALIFYHDISWHFVAGVLISAFLNVMGMTAGYHRLWCHKSYDAVKPIRYMLAMMGAMAWQGSIYWWILRHRMHHRFVDTKYDPYNSRRGLWFSHYGWLFEKPQFYDKTSLINMSDVRADEVCEWNRKYTPHLVVGLGMVLPALIGWWLGDALAGFLYIGVMGRCLSWNSVFALNSFAHYEPVGDREYALHQSATNCLLLAILTNGEGNHNYHHEFPHDYRHGVKWYDYDPTKWFIWTCSSLGLAWNLVRVDDHVRVEAENQVRIMKAHLHLDHERSVHRMHLQQTSSLSTSSKTTPPPTTHASFPPSLELPTPTADALLPLLLREDVKKGILPSNLKGKRFLIIEDYLLDVTPFIRQHPGGASLLQAYNFRDATKAFYSGQNIHTKAAHNIVKRLRVARLDDIMCTDNDDHPKKD